MSASLDEGRARALAAQCGATEYLVKPVEPAHLLATARRILANRENGAAAGHDPRR
jgi:DNA-binding response OmpR family regulator